MIYKKLDNLGFFGEKTWKELRIHSTEKNLQRR